MMVEGWRSTAFCNFEACNLSGILLCCCIVRSHFGSRPFAQDPGPHCHVHGQGRCGFAHRVAEVALPDRVNRRFVDDSDKREGQNIINCLRGWTQGRPRVDQGRPHVDPLPCHHMIIWSNVEYAHTWSMRAHHSQTRCECICGSTIRSGT